MDSGSPFAILNALPDTHLPHEDFAAHAALEARLRATVRGEVRFDPASRALYAERLRVSDVQPVLDLMLASAQIKTAQRASDLFSTAVPAG